MLTVSDYEALLTAGRLTYELAPADGGGRAYAVHGLGAPVLVRPRYMPRSAEGYRPPYDPEVVRYWKETRDRRVAEALAVEHRPTAHEAVALKAAVSALR